MNQVTFMMVKPDGFLLLEDINDLLKNNGLCPAETTQVLLTEDQVIQHYPKKQD